ncbi:UvrD-like helicase family protein [Flavobacterium limicola]|uniref:UvrD-like helicase family protein n=1 Tax=Flavobacterium limicola TaxID=180441 RepID=A0A495S3T6_9FLAO|nr:DEAD/DEAH box helicase [Flavobacterium limicola]RKS93846.1 UvrD-like helicase family protein [Flavobacterium limicola]
MEINLENKEFQNALELIENTNQTFFLTGKAGTGKSTFLKHIIKTVSKNFVVIAPTGIAAVNVNGVTIHSFFSFPLRPILPDDDDIKTFSKGSEKRSVIEAMDTLIIDEISMVRVDIIDAIDCSLRRNSGNPNLPFGGKQVVFVGDVFQLEPVTSSKTGEYEIIKEIYGNPYFFSAKVFKKINFCTVELLKVYRQTDLDFINLLDKVRIKEISQIDLDKINTRLISDKELINNEFTIMLSTTNDIANRVNQQKLIEISSKLFNYNAEISGVFDESKYPTDIELNLKVGAQVVFIKNDSEKKWFNGTIGKIEKLEDKKIIVKLEDGNTHDVEPVVWDNIKFQYNRILNKIESEVIGTFQQYPLKLAWAITIHKSQGLTFDKIIIDLGRGAFASGQAYVALSRARTIKGLFLKRRIFTTDIIVHNEVKKFAKSYNDETVIVESIKQGKELAENKDIVKEIFLKNPKLFVDLISRYYSLNDKLIEKYKDVWSWHSLAIFNNQPLSVESIEKFKDSWEWDTLSENKALPWSPELIEKFSDKWNWNRLSFNEALPWSIEFIERFSDKWDWEGLSSNEALTRSLKVILSYEDKWTWERLSYNEGLPWSYFIILLYSQKLDWKKLSENKAIPWDCKLIEEFKDNWDWSELSSNKALPWSIELIEKFKDNWNWNKLSSNSALPWNNKFFEKYLNEWDWSGLSNNVNILWTEQFIREYEEKWDWRLLSFNKSFPWNIEFIEQYIDKWNWLGFSSNENLPWSIGFFEKHEDKWLTDEKDWRNKRIFMFLSKNTSLPWSVKFINKFPEKWKPSEPIWKTLQPYVDDKMIELICNEKEKKCTR